MTTIIAGFFIHARRRKYLASASVIMPSLCGKCLQRIRQAWIEDPLISHFQSRLVQSAAVLGGSNVHSDGELTSGLCLGLDWFVLNVIFTGFLFIPIQRFFAHNSNKPPFQ